MWIFPIVSDEIFFNHYIKNLVAKPIDGMEKYTALDLCLVKNDVITAAIEVFNFDGLENDQGSKYLSERGRMKREFKEKSRNFDNYDMSKNYEFNYNFQTSLKSFVDVFEKHYVNIPKYKEILKTYSLEKSLKSENTPIGFLIRDLFPTPTQIVTDNKTFNLTIFDREDILNYLYNKSDLDFIMYYQRGNPKDTIIFLKLDVENLSQLLRNSLKGDGDPLLKERKTKDVLLKFTDTINIEVDLNYTVSKK